MDVYTLNEDFEKEDILEGYESFIWSERYSEFGDVEVKGKPTSKLRGLLRKGTYLSHPESDRVMKITKNTITRDEDGAQILLATGTSLEEVLDERTVEPNWTGSGTVGGLIYGLVNRICVEGNGISPSDVVPNMQAVNMARFTPHIEASVEFKSLFETIKELADSHNLGFRIVLRKETPRLSFEVYRGQPRDHVVFDTELDTLTNPEYVVSDEDYKNIAYVRGQSRIKVVAAPGINVYTQGFARRVMAVDATDLNPLDFTDDQYDALLTQRGREALSEHRRVEAFDGEIPLTAPYKYGEDYLLGDLVSIRGEHTREKQEVRITEYIWSSDSEGDRSYPTFTAVEEESS